ncbi:hypothetical protein [Streptomyces sp. NPDC050988]|uniref:hypothetical protein n=1 Tax=Streptomyces sp. NPDC050988 TaxID=3365637 RepID=UPI00378782D6
MADVAWWSAALWSGMRSITAVRTAPRLMPRSRAWVAVAGLRGTRLMSAMVLPGQPIVTTAVALGLGDPQPVVGHFPLETALQFAGGSEACTMDFTLDRPAHRAVLAHGVQLNERPAGAPQPHPFR